MSSERLGEFIKRLFTDSGFKQAFLSDPNNVMDKFGLGKQAKTAILSIGVVAIAGATDITRVLAAADPMQIWWAQGQNAAVRLLVNGRGEASRGCNK